MKKTRLLASVMAAVMLILPACGKKSGDTGTEAPATDAPVITTEEIGDSQAMTEYKKQRDITFATDITLPWNTYPLMEAFNALSFEEKCSIPYNEFELITGAAYSAVNSERLWGIDSRGQEVIAAVAKAYYDQSFGTHGSPAGKPQVLYDQYNSRRNYNATPEDATDQKNLYLDCSAFVGAVYYYTFGVNLLSGKSVSTANLNTEFSAVKPQTDSELMYYITGTELAGLKADSAAASAKIAEIKSVLQPGDIINYRRSTGTGHVVMYLGNQKIIHSTGTANPKTSTGEVDPKTSIEKNAVDEKVFGTVNIDDWDRFFTKNVTPKSQNDGRSSTSNSYLFADNVSAIAIIRPLSEKNGRLKGKAVTDGAKDHYLYQGIDIEKTAKVNRGGQSVTLFYGNSCFAGEEITYTVTVLNNSDTEMKSLTFREKVPNQLEYVSSCEGSVYFADDKTVAMYVPSIPAGGKILFTYTLRVGQNNDGGKSVNDAETYVNSIKTNALINQVCAYEIDKAKFESAVAAVTGQKFTDGIAAAKAIYAKLTDKGFACIADQKDEKGMIDTYLREHILRNGEKYGYAVVRTLYGGYKVGSAEVTNANKNLNYASPNIRIRRVMKANLEDGDIIVTYSSFLKEYRTVIYFNNGVYGLLSDGTFGKLTPSKLSTGATGTIQDYLDTLTAYNDFLVFRPALLG